MRFPLAPRSMTLDISCYKFEFSENFADLRGNNCKADDDTRIFSESVVSHFFDIMFLALICRSFARGLHTCTAVARLPYR